MKNYLEIGTKRYYFDELPRWAKEKLSGLGKDRWEYDLWYFIDEWYSERNAVVVTTSGSTGNPISIELPKQKMRASAHMTLRFLELKPNALALLCLPVKYIAGKMMLVRALEGRLNLLVSEPSANPIEGIKSPVDFAAFIPLQIEKMLVECEEKLRSIEKMIIGGASVNPELKKRLASFPNEVYETYGMTETITHVALKRLNLNAPSFFKALPEIGFSADQRNCLVIDAPAILNEQLTTNDVVELIDSTSFEWKGRYDNIINSGAIKLNPETIEQKIAERLANDYFLGSWPDKKLGEKPVLFIEGREPNDREKEELWQYLKATLDKYEVPKEIIWVKEFERTGTGKIRRMRVQSKSV